MDHVRQHIQQDHQCRGIDDVGVEQQEGQGRRQENQARQAHQEMHHGVGITDALEHRQAFAQQWIVGAKNLRHAARPADTLADMRRQAFGGQACCLGYAQVSRIPALAMQSQRRVGILGHGFHGEASNRVHCGAPQHGTRATEEGGIPHVVAVLHQAVEQLALVGATPEHVEVAFEGVRRQEVVGCLYQRQLRIMQEPAYGELQKRAHRHMVAIENRHQFTIDQA
ncbi:hypothetical protein D9M73_151540 [compost metagenome]